MEVIGHRGAAALAPENTLQSLGVALAAGADGVEVDVRLTRDGVAVLLHDADLSRTTDGTGSVSHVGFQELRGLDAGYAFAPEAGHPARGKGLVVATLEEALDLVPADRLLILEVKGLPWESGHDPREPAAGAVAEALSRRPPRRVVVSSFNPMALARIREAVPRVRTGMLTAPAFDLGSNLAAAVDGGHEECHVPASILDRQFVERAHDAGRRVVAWTVDEPERIRAFEAWGVDGVIADDPGAARGALSSGL